MTATSREVVQLYRRVLKLAKQYPSIKREAIIQDIKIEFHDAKHITDPRVIQEKIASARAGIKELAQYTTFQSSATSWAVDIGREVQPVQYDGKVEDQKKQ